MDIPRCKECRRRVLPNCPENDGVMVDGLCEDCHEPLADEYPPCPICKDPIDYCQGHPEDEMGDIDFPGQHLTTDPADDVRYPHD